jgi:hypothetical protein
MRGPGCLLTDCSLFRNSGQTFRPVAAATPRLRGSLRPPRSATERGPFRVAAWGGERTPHTRLNLSRPPLSIRHLRAAPPLRIAGDHQLRVSGPRRCIMPRHLHRRAAGTVVEVELAISQSAQVSSMKSSATADDVEQLSLRSLDQRDRFRLHCFSEPIALQLFV